MARLLILTRGELSRDPRARRAALAAKQRGLDVVGVSASSASETAGEIEGIPVRRVRADRISGPLRRAGLGGMRPSRPILREIRGLYRVGRLAAVNARLALAARGLGPIDVVHANDFDTLPAGALLARIHAAHLVYDSHELYTSQEPDPPRVFSRVVGLVEGALARRASAVVTSGAPYARELERRLGLDREPLVVLNCPERDERRSEAPADGRLRLVYQAAMGPGRPLADILTAAQKSEGAEITLRVVGADEADLRRRIADAGVGDRVHVSSPVPPDRLLEGLAGFHVGLIINRPITLTDELVVPNKLFEYMMAGLAVVAPRLPGLAELVDGEGIGLTFEPGRPEDLGRAVSELAADRRRVGEMQARARRLALERFNAETQAEALQRAWSA